MLVLVTDISIDCTRGHSNVVFWYPQRVPFVFIKIIIKTKFYGRKQRS